MDNFTFTIYTKRGIRKEEGKLQRLKETDHAERKERKFDKRRE
jgi:hypothetical protein